MFGRDRPEKNSAECLIRSGEIRSPRQTSIGKNNDCAVNSERGALVRGSDPPSGYSVHKTTGDTWWVPARRLTKIWGRWCVENERQRISTPLRWRKIYFEYIFSCLAEERRTSRAAPRILGHGSTWYLRGRHLHSLALPDTERVGRGFMLLIIMSRSNVYRRMNCFWSACRQFSTWKHKFRCGRVNKYMLKTCFSPRFPVFRIVALLTYLVLGGLETIFLTSSCSY